MWGNRVVESASFYFCLHVFQVRRKTIWLDVRKKLQRIDLDKVSNGYGKTQFIGEPAEDEGGPTRELFTLLHKTHVFVQPFYWRREW